MKHTHYISSDILDLAPIREIIEKDMKLALSEEARLNVIKSHEYLVNKMDVNDSPIYGINTGFGSLCNVDI